MHARLKAVNALLALSIFPMTALVAKDYLVLRYPPRLAQAQAAGLKAAAPVPDFESYAPIVERGLFPARSRVLKAVDMVDASAGAPPPGALSDVKLLGTFTGRDSMAVFERGGVQEVVRLGSEVFGSGTLVGVTANGASVASGASEVSFTVYREDLPSGLAPEAAEGSKRRGRYTEKVSENEWIIDQGALKDSLSDMGRILTDARLTPRLSPGGAVDGFIVSEIKPKGVFEAIGLRDGDVLASINGLAMDSPEKAVQVLSGLRGETSISLDIIRGGQKRNLKYTVR